VTGMASDPVRSLRAALRRAEEGVRLRDEFLATLAHELYTPLTTLTLAVSRLGEETASAETAQLARLIERQARRVARLMAELLSTGKDGGLEPMVPERTDLGALVKDVVAHLALELQRAECEISLALDGAVVGLWDGERLERVVFNLLSNACKFGKGAAIEVRLTQEGAVARLAITDHGCGIGALDRARLFTRFGRGASASGRGGLGLGLYNVRRIVEAHGGRVGVASARGKGATFTVELPCEGPRGRSG
jgi:signal transduction histidine kinase